MRVAAGAVAVAIFVIAGAGASGAGTAVTCLGETATKVGTPGDDVIAAVSSFDAEDDLVVAGLGGNDAITVSGDGRVTVCGGDGNDRIVLTGGAETVVSGDAGDD